MAHQCLRCMRRTLLFRRRSASSRWSRRWALWRPHYNLMWREYRRAKVLGMMHQFPGEWCWVFQISYRSRKVSVLSCRKSTKFLNSFVPFFSVSKPYFLYVCLTYFHILRWRYLRIKWCVDACGQRGETRAARNKKVQDLMHSFIHKSTLLSMWSVYLDQTHSVRRRRTYYMEAPLLRLTYQLALPTFFTIICPSPASNGNLATI